MRLKRTLAISLFCAAALAVNEGRIDPVATTASGVKDFGFQLFKSLSAAKATGPVAISPMSVAEALTLATHGAENETLVELQNLFLNESVRSEGADLTALTEGLGQIRQSLNDFTLKSGGAFQYNSANSLWGNNNRDVQFQFTEQFLQVAKDKYGAEANARDFADRGTVKEINDWVAKKTQDKIKNLLDQLRADDVAVIVNAIYSKGKFKNNFTTVEEGEYRSTPNSAPQTVSFLTKEEKMGYFQDENLEAFSFKVEGKDAYKEGETNQIALDVIVPKDGDMAGLVQKLDGSYYGNIVDGLADKDIRLTLAAGKVEQKEAARLKGVLNAEPFNVTRSFDSESAQFGQLGSVVDRRNLYINDILTKTFYEVTPFGFEAAAATAVIFARETAILRPPVFEPHKIDSASLHVIRHIPTGTPLFIVTYDSPVRYAEQDLLNLVEEGFQHSSYLTAKTAEGNIVATYDRTTEGFVLALVKDGKIVKTYKPLHRGNR